MKYLKEKQHYINRYDLFTIKECLEAVDSMRKDYVTKAKKEKAEGLSKGERAKGYNWATNQMLYVIKAERYRPKDELIQKWMDQDQKKQEKYNTTPEPPHVQCPDCKNKMQPGLKHLETFDEPLRMMFLFTCPSCKKKRWIYEDGTERESEPNLCPKCKAEVKISVVKEGTKKVTWKTICSSCSFTETTVEDFEKSRAESKKKEEEEKKLLDTYQTRFCGDEEGKKSLDYIEALVIAPTIFDEALKKYDNHAYEKLTQLKILSISDLEKSLSEIVTKVHYMNLTFDKPQMGQHVIVSFSLQDTDSSRNKDVRVTQLQKLIKERLEKTNWRLMTDGLSYRLGYISGRLKGYEREEDLFELSGKKKEEQPSKIDYETRMIHEGHHVVQLARLMGEIKGIKNMRERRLKEEPDGFFLESTEDFYSCGICGVSMPGNKTWWNMDGVRCVDCQRNIQEGIIPSEIHKNRDIWIAGWQLSSKLDFSIQSSTLRKLRKEGLLHGRDLKKEDGTVYFTVYLISENKEFLDKYPRKPQPKMIITDLLGNKVEL